MAGKLRFYCIVYCLLLIGQVTSSPDKYYTVLCILYVYDYILQ